FYLNNIALPLEHRVTCYDGQPIGVDKNVLVSVHGTVQYGATGKWARFSHTFVLSPDHTSGAYVIGVESFRLVE
ncbi:hypothetical protein HK096_010474, partial [Nowakowskiella sp. JEL0078]